MFAQWDIVLFSLLLLIHRFSCLNLGLISGDLKRSSSPLSIKKISHHSPIFINVHPKSIFDKPSITLPKLPSKPPPSLDIFSTALPQVKPKLDLLKPKLPKLKSLPLLATPSLLKVPLIPFLPPLLPLIPKIPLLPLLPVPKLPLLPLIPSLAPLKIPSLGKKSLLQKAFGSELYPVTLLPSLEQKKKENVLEMLLELKARGSLTTVEFHKLKRLLLK